MAEYIDKEAFLAKETKQYCSDCERRKGIKNGKRKIIYEIGEAPCRSCGINDVIDDIDSFPTSDDVKPVVRGKWEHFGSDVFRCSECGYGIQPWNIGVNFCPNCGADMREES